MGAEKPDTPSLYETLGLQPSARDVEIKRAYRTLASQAHPDKPGGDAERFQAVQRAWEVLSDPAKRAQYDATGTWERSAEDDFLDSFAGGALRDRVRAAERAPKPSLSELVAVAQDKSAQSHTAGFEAFMRARGEAGARVYTVDDVIEQFGVVKASYEGVPLPKIKAHTVRCATAGPPQEVLKVEPVMLPAELEWGQVLVSIRAAPISPADLFTVQTGAYDRTAVQHPFTPGTAGVGVVVKLGPGCKSLAENDWVIPAEPGVGTWASLVVAREKDLIRLPADCMPVEQLACYREALTAYRLLEDSSLKPGDAVLLNAATSCTGQYLLQLCAVLRLRAIAVVSPGQPDFEKVKLWLTALGAAQVLTDEGSLRLALEEQRFFSKPKLALDAVGGASGARLAEALAEGGALVMYGVMSGKSTAFQWRDWLFGGLKASGFNLTAWMKANRKKVPALVESLAKLVNAGKLSASVTEYELATEFGDALEHAVERHRNTKVVLRVNDVGEQI